MGNPNKFNEIISKEFVLNIDLDFLSKTTNNDEIEALSENEMDQFFIQKIKNLDNCSVSSLMERLIANSTFITICRESGCCGGLGASNQILKYLDLKFFENKITSFSPWSC